MEKLRLSDNTGAAGLSVGNGSMVKDCVSTANAIGFYCPDRTQISHCIATVNTSHGFDCTSYVNSRLHIEPQRRRRHQDAGGVLHPPLHRHKELTE